jgi:CHASE2 domain-containing sensor protein
VSEGPEPGLPEDEPTQQVARSAAPDAGQPDKAEPDTDAHITAAVFAKRRSRQSDPWGFLIRAMAYETLVVLVTAASVGALLFLASLILFRGQLQDVYLRLRGPAPISAEVSLVTVGPEALYLFNPADPHPDETPRELLAELVTFLDAAGASVVVLDFLIAQPAPGDALLAAASVKHGSVIAAERFEITEPASGRVFTPGIPPILESAMGSGFANFQEEPSSWLGSELLVRRLPLLRTTDRAHLSGPWPLNQVGAKQDIDEIVPALSLAAAWRHRALQSDPQAKQKSLTRLLQAQCTPTPLLCTATMADLGLPDIPLQLSEPHDINFRGPEGGDGLVTVDAARILRILAGTALLKQLGQTGPVEVPEDLRLQLEGRVVVVGRVDVHPDGTSDRFATPYSLPLQDHADMSGPRIHAHAIDTLLSGRHIRHSGGWVAWLLALGVCGGVWVSYNRLPDTLHGAVWLGITAGVLTVGFVTFRISDGFVLDLGPVVAACLIPTVILHLRGWVRDQAGLPR